MDHSCALKVFDFYEIKEIKNAFAIHFSLPDHPYFLHFSYLLAQF